MIHRSFTAVIERNTVFAESFVTEPYEAGWAKEARWFVRVLDITPGTQLTLRGQLSPDGLFWCDDDAGTTAQVVAERNGLYTFVQHHFGHWLALRGELECSRPVEGVNPSVKLIIYLALKE